jgi:hypothetical protein
MVTGPVDPWINDYAKMGLNPPVLVHLAIKARSPRFYVMRWPCHTSPFYLTSEDARVHISKIMKLIVSSISNSNIICHFKARDGLI